jgi:hypothetical protein
MTLKCEHCDVTEANCDLQDLLKEAEKRIAEHDRVIKELKDTLETKELELDGVMFLGIDKWLDEGEGKGMDATQRAGYVREKLLKIIEGYDKQKAELEKKVMEFVKDFDCEDVIDSTVNSGISWHYNMAKNIKEKITSAIKSAFGGGK